MKKIKLEDYLSSKQKARIYIRHRARNAKTREDGLFVTEAISRALGNYPTEHLILSGFENLILDMAFKKKK